MRYQLFLGAAAVALVMPAAASAQETTSIIRGTVTSADGAPVAGAPVTVTHVPSGSVSTQRTNADGSFQLSGLRVGGPFTVVAGDVGDQATVTDIFTQLGQPFDLPIVLAGGTDQDIVVTASSVSGSGTRSQGPQTLLRSVDIAKVASVNRDVRDLARRDPFATIDLSNNRAVSFAGVNPRFNRFSINGVGVNDTFGLNSDANPTRRGPVPLDAIDQFTVSVAPVDIRQGNFTGGVIDLVLRAGTNDYEGTGFYSLNTDGLTGNRIGSNTVVNDFRSQTYGGRLSGPIIKDKLFIMVAAERTTQGLPNGTGPAGEGFGASIPNLTRAQITQVQGIAQSVYNYATGDVIRGQDELDEKIVGRIDWNIAEGQKLFLTYTNAFDSLVIPQGSSASNSTPSVGLQSNGYLLTELQRAGQIQLNSDWSDSFSTEARIGYLSFKRGQDPLLGRGFGQFTVCLDPTSTTSATSTPNTSNATTCNVGSPRVVFGPDVSRQSNAFFSDTYQASLQARLTLGNHSLKVLGEFSESRVFNLFVQNSAGAFFFDSIADFQNRNAATLTLQGAVSGNINDAAANFKSYQFTFGVQDDWAVTDNLNVTFGARYDLFDQSGPIALNTNFTNRTRFPNTETLAGRGVLQPRFGFDWKPISRLSVRGSAGIFAGGNPGVYIANSYSNTGVVTNTINIQRGTVAPVVVPPATSAPATTFNTGTPAPVGAAALNGVNGTSFDPTVTGFLSTNVAALAAAPVNSLDPGFDVPSVFRASLNADYKFDFGPLGDGWNFGVSYLFSDQRSQVLFTDVRSIPTGLVLPDGRRRFNVDPSTPGSLNADINLTNSTSGRSHIGVVRFNKAWDFGLSIGGSYTLQDVTDRSPATSSVAFSNYTNAAYSDANIPALGISNDQTRWQFKYNVGFDHAFFGDYRTIIQLFGETKAGRHYSYTFQDLTAGRSSVFGTVGRNDRYLLYVPTAGGDTRVSYDSAATQTAFEGLIGSTVLRNFRGQIAPRNIARSRANTRIDLHLEQEIPTFVGGSRVSIYADIENLPNLLNRNWGGLRQVAFPFVEDVVRVQCLQTPVATGTAPGADVTTTPAQGCAQYRYSAVIQPADSIVNVNQSLYFIRIGARVTF